MTRKSWVEDIETYAQDIVDTVREPLLMLDSTLRVQSANRAFYQTFKVSSEETENRLIYELGNGQWDIPDLRALLEDVVPMSSVFNDFELEHTFPVIGRRVMLLNARKLRAGSHAELLVLAMEDVTERRRAEADLKAIETYAQDIVDTVREPLLILDATLRVRSGNRAFYRTFQVSLEETENQLIYELGNGQWDIPDLRILLEDIVPKSSVFNDFQLEHDFPAIGRRVMLLNARKLKAGHHGELLVLAMEDVTDRRRAEEEKKRAHDRETDLFAQLQKNHLRLQQLENLRDDTTNMIIHDLRSPLNGMMLGLHAVKELGDLNEEQKEMLGLTMGGGKTLVDLINELLDISKMEGGAIELELREITAADLIDAAVLQVAALVTASNLTLFINVEPDLPRFVADEAKLLRALVNLLGNAIKFTPSGGALTVAARADHAGPALLFSVHDTGEGIPSEAFGRIFEKFGQVNSRRERRTLSTGLGLTFCKLAVEAHGGQIGVESAPGLGSTFTFTIPLPGRG